jgi:hypothetical protein
MLRIDPVFTSTVILAASLAACPTTTRTAADERPEPLPPVEYLAHLQEHVKIHRAYTQGFDGPAVRVVREGDLPKLMELLEKQDRCAATIKAGLARMPDGSTVGHEAGVLIDSFRSGRTYPVGETSTDHKIDAAELKAWFKARDSQLCLRDDAGRLLVSSDEIEAYDWKTHTIVLRKGIGEHLRSVRLGPKPRLTHPFAMCIGVKPIYRGQFVSILSSQSVDEVCIVRESVLEENPDHLGLDLGYASAKLFNPDPRGDERIKAALEEAKKLK